MTLSTFDWLGLRGAAKKEREVSRFFVSLFYISRDSFHYQ
jgi:hypothetical protein